MADKNNSGWVTTRELAAELRSMRWEFRALIAPLYGVIAYKLKIPPVPETVGFILNLFF